MTSWIRNAPPQLKKKEEVAKPLLFSTTDEDIPTQLLRFYYSHIYARQEGLRLAVYDRNNSISPNVGVFQQTFYDMSGVDYVDTKLVSAIPVARREAAVLSHAAATPLQDLADEAQVFFELNNRAGGEVKQFLKGVGWPKEFDVGVFYSAGDAISVGTNRGVTVGQILQGLRNFQSRGGLTALRIFVASAESGFVTELKKAADKSWTIYTFPPTRIASAVGVTPNLRMRQDAFTQFLAEIVVLQNVPAVIGRLGSSLGRLLYLTRGDTTSFLSLDTTTFTVA